MSAPVVILGAGPAGIGAALSLGRDATILERRGQVAGLSRSIVLDGAIFDLGGHSFHTPHPHVRDLVFAAVEMEEQRRNAWCRVQDTWIAYPFQKHVSAIADPDLRAACIAGMAEAGDGRNAPNFDAYLDARFGRPVAEAFMRPYNRKLWGDDLARLTADWTDERVAGPLGRTEHFAEQGGQRTPLQADTRIAYPARGGFGAIFEALARDVHDIRTGTEVVTVDAERRTLTTRAGTTLGWEALISTLPLLTLLEIVAGVPPAIVRAAGLLEPIAVDLVMVVLEGRAPVDRQRVYCSDAAMPGHKVVLNHTSSRWLRDRPRHGIQVEVSRARPHAPGSTEAVVAELLRMGLILSPADIRRVERLPLKLGYPAPTHARASIVGEARAWLGDRGIHICGRFAEWAYVNADDALARGLRLGQELAGDRGPDDGRAGRRDPARA